MGTYKDQIPAAIRREAGGVKGVKVMIEASAMLGIR